MKLKTHIKIGRMIHRKMADNGMPLRKRMFILGSIAPDLYFSYIYRPHHRTSSGDTLNTHLLHLFDGGHRPHGFAFSFRLGIMAHYVCDFFCYAHTPAFDGKVRAHAAYEKSQTVGGSETRHFNESKGAGIGLEELASSLNEYFLRHEQRLSHDAESAAYDIPLAVHITAWAASVAYHHAVEETTPYASAVPSVSM